MNSFTHCTDVRLKERLLRPENLERLDNAIEASIAGMVLFGLVGRLSRLHLGAISSGYHPVDSCLEYLASEGKETDIPQSVDELFHAVREQVDSFLGVEDIPDPTIEYSTKTHTWITGGLSGAFASLAFADGISDADQGMRLLAAGCFATLSYLSHQKLDRPHYTGLTQTIRIPKRPLTRTELRAAVCHEYVHHVQNHVGILEHRHEIFSEGLATGAELSIAFHYGGVRDKTYSVVMQAGLLSHARTWAHASPHMRWRYDSPHALGTALFAIEERRHDSEVYRRALTGDIFKD